MLPTGVALSARGAALAGRAAPIEELGERLQQVVEFVRLEQIRDVVRLPSELGFVGVTGRENHRQLRPARGDQRVDLGSGNVGKADAEDYDLGQRQVDRG